MAVGGPAGLICLLRIGLMVCYFGGGGGGRQRRTVGCFAQDTTEVERDDFLSVSKAAHAERESKSRAVVCFTVRKGSVCIAQYYASLLPPTLQRAKPSNPLVYGRPDLVIQQRAHLSDHCYHLHDHHHPRRRRLRPPLPS